MNPVIYEAVNIDSINCYILFYTGKYIVNLIDYGIENKHYIKIAENITDWAPGTEQETKSGWKPGMSWLFGDSFLSYILKGEDPQKWDQAGLLEVLNEINKQYEEWKKTNK